MLDSQFMVKLQYRLQSQINWRNIYSNIETTAISGNIDIIAIWLQSNIFVPGPDHSEGREKVWRDRSFQGHHERRPREVKFTYAVDGERSWAVLRESRSFPWYPLCSKNLRIVCYRTVCMTRRLVGTYSAAASSILRANLSNVLAECGATWDNLSWTKPWPPRLLLFPKMR